MPEYASLRVRAEGSVARVTLARPDVHNAFDDAMIAELTAAAAALAADPAVRVVLLEGDGKSFCAGADLNWMRRMVDYGDVENLRDAEALARMLETWNDLEKPTVGRIHGAAMGGGAGLTAVLDVAVAADSTVFAFSEARLGILPAVISPFVTGKIGVSAARALFLTGERFPATRAREIGLVHDVVPDASLDGAVDAAVARLLEAGPEAQARIKRLLPHLAGRTPAEARPATARAIADARASAEGQEGIRSFLERRVPSWRKGS